MKYAYENKYGKSDCHSIMQNFILTPAGITDFYVNRPENSSFNQDDPDAGSLAGSPAGGYWMSSSDLAKFAQWIYKQCETDIALIKN